MSSKVTAAEALRRVLPLLVVVVVEVTPVFCEFSCSNCRLRLRLPTKAAAALGLR
jgi:hypothetical protein